MNRTTKHTTNDSTPRRIKRNLLAGVFVLLLLIAPAATGKLITHLQSDSARGTTAGKVAASLPAAHGPVHSNIVATVFWAGEPSDSENDHISNVPSAWDGEWQKSYGGYDDPDHRSGYNPHGFTPHENPFYFALPYNDLDENGNRKSTGHNCLPYTPSTNDQYSWCKNAWIAVAYNGKTVYAQWQDVGPNEEDDPEYVFGTAKPKNTFGEKAGLDVSPAVRDYLGLDGSDPTSWAFIPASAVPDGPWKAHITTSLGYKLTEQ